MRFLLLSGIVVLLFGMAWGQENDARVWDRQVRDISAVLWPDTTDPAVVQAARARVTADGTTYNAILDDQYFLRNCSVGRLIQSRLLDLLLLTARTDPRGSRRLAQRYLGLLNASLTLDGYLSHTSELPPFLTKIKAEQRRARDITLQVPESFPDDFDDRFAVLAAGGSIYLCTVERVTELPASRTRISLEGEELRVMKTLLGHAETRLCLHNSFGLPNGDHALSWPDPSKLPKGQLLLCLYLPGGGDAVPGGIPAGEGMMTEVIPVTGPDDPQVKDMQTFCDLYLETNSVVLKTKLQAALTRWDTPSLREFAFRMLQVYAREGHAADAVALAAASLADPQARPGNELWHDLMLLSSFSMTSDSDLQRQALRALGLLAQSPVPAIANGAIGFFRCRAQNSTVEVKPTLFTDAERATLTQTLHQRLTGDLNAEQRQNFNDLLQWLDGTVIWKAGSSNLEFPL